MSRTWMLTVALGFAVCCNSTFGGIIAKFPADGAWVKYFVEHQSSDSKSPVKGTVVIRFVGTTKVAGEKCRLVEIERTSHSKEMINGIEKYLVREKDFQLIKHWSRNVIDGRVYSFTYPKTQQKKEKKTRTWVTWFGPLQTPKKLKVKRVIDYQHGRLTIPAGVEGDAPIATTNVVQFPNDDTRITKSHVKHWQHENVPCGTAALEYTWGLKHRFRTNGELKRFEATQRYLLADFGTGAKSALPKQK